MSPASCVLSKALYRKMPELQLRGNTDPGCVANCLFPSLVISWTSLRHLQQVNLQHQCFHQTVSPVNQSPSAKDSKEQSLLIHLKSLEPCLSLLYPGPTPGPSRIFYEDGRVCSGWEGPAGVKPYGSQQSPKGEECRHCAPSLHNASIPCPPCLLRAVILT